MATVNNRLKKVYSSIINGVDSGGTMRAFIQYGWDEIIRSAPDGLQVAVQDKDSQFVRGRIESQDWVEFVNLLTGVVGTYVFYQRKSSTPEATGYVKHTLVNPVIYGVRLNQTKGGYITITAEFECRAADETKGITDMWSQLDSQAAPSYIAAARGGWRVVSTTHGTGVDELNIYHVTDFSFGIAMNLVKACNDGDVAYTCVDAELESMACDGSISFQDSAIDTGNILCQRLAVASVGPLILTVKQSAGAANKVITIANVDFSAGDDDANVNDAFGGYSMTFGVNNNPSVPLTLAGANKIITIADAA